MFFIIWRLKMSYNTIQALYFQAGIILEWRMGGGVGMGGSFIFPAAGQRNSREVISKYIGEKNAWVAAVYNVFQLPVYILENWV